MNVAVWSWSKLVSFSKKERGINQGTEREREVCLDLFHLLEVFPSVLTFCSTADATESLISAEGKKKKKGAQ